MSINLSILDQATILRISDGNPGALTFLLGLVHSSQHSPIIGTKLYFDLLDDLGLSGSRAYMLWNDCCDRDIGQVELVLHNYQKGHLSKEDINNNLNQIRAVPFTGLKSFGELGI